MFFYHYRSNNSEFFFLFVLCKQKLEQDSTKSVPLVCAVHGKLIGDMHAAMQSAGFPVTRLLCFPQPVYPSGWWSATLAQRSEGPLAVPEDCPLDTLYYTPAIHAGALNVPPFLQKALDQAGAR